MATLLILAPAASAADAEYDYPESGEDPVATFSASDPDAEADDIEWSLGGVDADDFEIDGGVLTFEEPPDFEKPSDRDEDTESAGDQGKGDNVYMVTVEASGGELEVAVTVTNENEPGKVTFDQPQPQATRDLTASFSDEDGDDGPGWQWSRGASMEGPWTDIAGAMTAARNPTAADIGSYLRATVTYEDSFGEQTVSGVTANAVEARTLANAAPAFPDKVDPISVKENATGAIGDPIVATDPDNDILLYSIVADVDGDDLNDTLDDAENTTDDEKFKIGKTTGQLSLVEEKGENFEDADNRVDDSDPTDGTIAYMVTIRATDPSGATGDKTITVNLMDVNESPVFTAPSKDQKTLYIDENEAVTTLYTHKTRRTGDAGFVAAADYDADDNDSTRDGTPLDADDAIRYSLEGADDDEDSFSIDPEVGTLTSAVEHDFEDQSSYSLVVVATSGGTVAGTRGDRERIGKMAVTVMVVDGEDDGTVEFSAREPQVGRAVIATLTDKDGGETAVTWQWYRGGSSTTPVSDLQDLEDDPTVDPNRVCDDGENNTPVSTTAACVLDGAKSALYTPDADDVGQVLQAVATYKDNIASDQDEDTEGVQVEETARGVSEAAVERSDPANTAPAFPDQDLNTAGDQSDTAMRSVEENKKGARVGEPVGAGDADDDLLLYTISGDDAGSFKVGRKDGQLTTAEKLDFETKSSYTVMVTATDPSGATDTITAMIMVTDEDDGAVITGVEGIDYAENGEDPVATFSAMDPDADAGDIEWSLDGVDKADFELDGGVLTFKESPDFEKPSDRDEKDDEAGDQGKGDNVYMVTVKASGGELEVAVTVTNENEPGKVTFDQPQPQATRNLKASMSDEDGDEGPAWQWSRGAAMDGPWADIAGAMTAARKPTAADVGSYLRATVTYEDSFGEQTVSGVTANAVEGRTVSNASPKFPDKVDPISVKENATGAIGDPIVATDADNDVLLYSIVADVDTDDDGTIEDTENTTDDTKFKIGGTTGQLSLANEDGEDFEAAGNAVEETGDATGDDMIPYMVTIRATDPSGATGDKTITVNLMDVNESPEFQAPSKDQKKLYIDENDDNPDIRTGKAATDGAAVPYQATDDDTSRTAGTALDDADDIRYSLEGADDDEDSFVIDPTTGALTTATDLEADFEDQSSYSLVIVATSGGTDAANRGDRERIGKMDVTVMVVDGEDGGTVDLSAREPQVGRAVIATLSDKDGGETAVTWQWYRGGAATTVAVLQELVHDPAANPNQVCDDEDDNTAAGAACVLDGAKSALYTPDADDVGEVLHAVATYKDNIDSDQDDTETGVQLEETARAESERPVETSDPANTAPAFPDQDLNTAGDQSDTAMRSVEENKKGARVGEPIGAGDADDDLLLYTHSGDDAGSFKIGRKDGQLTTAEKLDFETKDMYMVMVTATDPSGAYDKIMVTIMVTDEDDGAVISTGPVENTPPAFDAGTATRNVNENMYAGAAVGDPVTATDDDAGDTVTYTLSGSTYFGIDGSSGQISTTMMLDHEAMSTHTVTVTATDSEDATDTVDVTINVNNAHTGCDTAGNMYLVNDCEALLDSKDALGGSLNWAALPMSDWDGVTLSGDPMRVTAIMLRDQGLNGTIPASLGRLSALSSLNLRSNPDLSGEIPGSLNNLSSLTVLNLHSNSHTGEIPDLSGTALQELYLSNNELMGSVPAWLNMMSDMTELWLTGNNLAGAMPDLSGMASLDKLKVNGNSVSGLDAAMLPGGLRWLIAGETDMGETAPDLSSLMNITTLWMNKNGLEGQIPVASIPSSVSVLNLRDNSLSGAIPDMSGLDNLRYLYLNSNSLSGDIPGTMGDMASIERIWLHENDLTGISAGLDNASDTLTHLELRGNDFAEGTCLPGDLAMVENNDFEMAGLAACGDGS